MKTSLVSPPLSRRGSEKIFIVHGYCCLLCGNRINILPEFLKNKPQITSVLSEKCTLFLFQISNFCYAWHLLPFTTLIETVIIDATLIYLFLVEIVYTEPQIQ